ncbi:PREDICTED: protein HVA22-like [Fragaria vesca subsp. vesca]
MGKAWFLLTKLHSLAWPGLTLAYPLYASLMAMEGGDTSKPDVQQWLAYWIMYALLSPLEMLLQPLLQWIPFWYDLKLVFVAWLVLPQFGGACFLYEKFVRDHALRLVGRRDHPRHQAAILEPSQPLRRGMPNARNTSTHDQSDRDSRRDTFTRQSDTVNVQDRGTLPSNTGNVRDTSARGGRMSPPEGSSTRLVHKPGKRKSLFSWSKRR